MYYYASHRFLWPLLRGRVLPCMILSIIVFVNLFLWTYLPQVAFLAIFYGRALAWVNGVFLVLGEGATIIAILFEAFFVDETLVDIFDAVCNVPFCFLVHWCIILMLVGCQGLNPRRPRRFGAGRPRY
jgi:hypothetical protein